MYQANVSVARAIHRSRNARGITWLACLILTSPVTQSFARPQQAEQAAEIKHFVFSDDGSGRTAGHGALEISFHRYRSADGITVERDLESYRSEQEARSRLQTLIAGASKVIERGYKKAWDGRQVGERVRLVTQSSTGTLNIIAWTDRSKVCVLRSESLRHVLDFEGQDYPSARPKNAPVSHP
jgi:hypothetical protein